MRRAPARSRQYRAASTRTAVPVLAWSAPPAPPAGRTEPGKGAQRKRKRARLGYRMFGVWKCLGHVEQQAVTDQVKIAANLQSELKLARRQELGQQCISG